MKKMFHKLITYLKKLIDYIVEIVLKLRRQKTLNYLLYISIGLISRELINLSSGLDEYFKALRLSIENIKWWQEFGLRFFEIVFSNGSFLNLSIYCGIFILLFILKKAEIEKIQNSSLVDKLNERIFELEEDNEGAQKKLEKGKKQFEKEKNRIIKSIERKGISTDKLIRKYDKPLNAILISYSSQKNENVNGKIVTEKFLREELSRFGLKSLGGSDFLIPPSHVPKSIRTRLDLEKWFEHEILKGRYCKIKFLLLIDLNKNSFWKNYLPYTQKKPFHHTIGEVLSIDDIFTENQINKIAISDIIKSGDILWLASSFLSEEESEIIQKNQHSIEKQLNNPSLRIIGDDKYKNRLTEVLSEYIENAEEISQKIINEAKYWKKKLI
jgi:hypothetical protein